jgi:hypothetical protein
MTASTAGPYEALWTTLVEFANDHADPTTASCSSAPTDCPYQDQLGSQLATLLEDDAKQLMAWLVQNLVREGTLIAQTRGNDGDIPLAGFKFRADETAGILSGALVLGHYGHNSDLADAAHTLLTFAPPIVQSRVIAELFQQLIEALLDRRRQLLGKKNL